jgi:hypothetical protein
MPNRDNCSIGKPSRLALARDVLECRPSTPIGLSLLKDPATLKPPHSGLEVIKINRLGYEVSSSSINRSLIVRWTAVGT